LSNGKQKKDGVAAFGGKTFLEKSFSPKPPFPKTLADWVIASPTG
jgi:hypothetical protein